MATLALAVAGAAAGSGLLPAGVTILGATLTGATIGAQVGALAGSFVDQALLGASGARTAKGPRLSELRITGASEGAPIPRLYGRARLGGQLIWATDFEEEVATTSQSGGGKGGVLAPKTKTTEYRYYASFAIALCEGEIAGIGRVWADGAELDLATVAYRVHAGSATQAPDSLIEAHEGAGNAPAFRGTAYVVFERLALADFGNRIPQLSFEVHRPVDTFAHRIRAVTLIPGAGEFAYAQEPVTRSGSVDVIAGQPFMTFLDLPLLRGDEPPAAGYIAAAQTPWPGPIAVYRSPDTTGFQLHAIASAPAPTGVTLDPLPAGATSRLDRAAAVRVKLDSGALASVTELALLGGANAAAVRNADGEWEVLQFRSAVLTASATYALSGFLRGQAGTEHAMRAPLAAGARFVLLDGALTRLDLTEDELGLAFNWRCGPASRDLGSPHYMQLAHPFRGEGLKPLSPVHVRATRFEGDLHLTWVRRTRIGGNSWDTLDVPLGEAQERYEIDILDGPTVRRTLTATTSAAIYTAAQQTADFGAPQPSVSLRLHQLSATRGRGTPREAVV